tara:strand:+ start:1791 stop:2528 length:738 start_codon:yes stop_codon:yes gene_type:complete
MFKYKSQRIGFFGTLFFHLILFIICFFSTIGYTSIYVPSGIEITFVPYIEKNTVDQINEGDNLNTVNTEINDKNNIEKLIVDTEETLHIPSDEDTMSLSDFNDNKSLTISSQLADALSKLNQNNIIVHYEETLLTTNTDLDIQSSVKNDPDSNLLDGYELSDNRFAVRKVKPNYSCSESGKVVVRVWVNREGKTIKADPGIRGTTESASCLLNEAKIAALQTTWTPYVDAPDIQIGQITYNFHQY